MQSAIAFSRAEAHATVLLERPRLEWSQEVWTADNAITLNLSFLRDLLSARVPDAFVPAGLLGAWLLGVAFGPVRWNPARIAAAAVAGVAAAAVGGAVLLGAGVREQASRAGLQDPAEYLLPRVENLSARLGREMPEGDQIPSRQAVALMPFMAFCSGARHRPIVCS